MFNNEDLQRQIDLIEGDLEELLPQAKQVANDIAKLEATLSKKGFCIPISVFSHTTRTFSVGEDASFVDISEFVEWEKIDGSWRLALRREEGHGDLVLSKHCHYADTLDIVPLSEVETAVQLRANLVLGRFVEEVGIALKNMQPTNTDFPDWLAEQEGVELPGIGCDSEAQQEE